MQTRTAKNQPDTRQDGDHSHRPTDPNTGKPLFDHDSRIAMYQEPGPQPTRIAHYRGMSHTDARDEDHAAELESEGWHRTLDGAHKAAGGAPSKSDPAATKAALIATTMADIKGKNKDARVEYAQVLGVDTKGMNTDQVYAAIEAALKAQ